MEGCFPKMMKFLLIMTNFIVFILGLVTLGFGCWILGDKPSVLNLFTDAKTILADNNIDMAAFDLGIYGGAPILLIIIVILVVVISFCGCCGAFKENKIMLISYFNLILGIFIIVIVIVGAVLIFQVSIKDPLLNSIKYYNDGAKDGTSELAFKQVWNEVQKELRCCGVNNATDWNSALTPNWEDGNKPVGCCFYSRNKEAENTAEEIKVCREAPYNENDTYYFQGCYTVIEKEIKGQENKILWAAMGTIAVMFFNMLFSCAFALWWIKD